MNGNIGFELAKKNIPDLIITDLMMPEMTGEDLTKNIRATDHLSHIPILVLSAKSRTLDKIELYKIGADNYLQKPFDMEELQVIVSNLLEQRRKLRETFKAAVFESKEDSVDVADFLEDSFMMDLAETLEQHLGNSNFTIVELCQELSVGRNQLQKKVKALTNMTPVEFVRSFRIKHAYELLKDGKHSVSEVAYKVGFNNLSYFTRMFKKQFGVLPSSILNKYEIQT
jgi:YesN/AraC family two-component response regulator